LPLFWALPVEINRREFLLLMAGLFVAANMVTYSRGGFLGLIAAVSVLAWKIGRKNRLNVLVVLTAVGGLFILAAPGNYGLRILSMFVPGLDESARQTSVNIYFFAQFS
jgi:O-antigen ligase